MIDKTPEIYSAMTFEYDKDEDAEMAVKEFTSMGVSDIEVVKPQCSSITKISIATVKNKRLWDIDEALTIMFSRVDNYLNTIKEITKKYNGKICIDIAFYEYGTYPALLFSGENMKKIHYLEADISIDPYSIS